MARSFGRKNTVNKDLFAYNIMLLGEAGVGKTSMMADVMRRFCKEDEYLMLQIGKEEGCKAINGLMWEQITTWKEFTSFVDEVVKNRDDWGTLRCVVIDTIDQLIEVCTPHVIKMWNSSQMGKKDFSPAVTLNQAWGGFGKADEYMMGLILDQIWRLKSVGVAVFVVGHTRRRDNVDPVSGLTYSTMSAAISLKNFDALKTKMDIVSIAYINREMTSKEFGRENIMTKKKDKINEVTNEARMVAFRSSAYVLDSKSRFPDIIDEVPMDANAFVDAIQDAINKAAERGIDVEPLSPKAAPAKKNTKKAAPAPVVEEEDELEDVLAQLKESVQTDEIPFDVEDEVDMFADDDEVIDADPIITLDSDRLAAIRTAFKAADASVKKEVKKYLANYSNKLSEEMHQSDVDGIEAALGLQ
jgi:hypothetical protein